ncbi:MAG: glycosyl hydrolase-related protein [Planctomycetaceae bacterium]|nr:glycosyl hydrolase-related protein [Planctomycetaceae bacterium]
MKKAGLALMFIVFCAGASIAGVYTEKSKWELSKDKVLYTVGYSHLDTQWRWDYQKTINDYIKATLYDNIAMLEKYPEYTFNFTGAVRYEMMKEYYPEKYEEMKKYIEQGRWFVSGSSFEEGDALAPSVESLIRQILLGNEYFRKEFGKMSSDYILPDCFGFMAHTPSIWAHCGLLGFSTQKLTWNCAVGIPFNIGVWEGVDGKSLVCAFNPGHYSEGLNDKADANDQWTQRIEENGQKYGLYADYHYYGIGDSGGAPKEAYIQNYTDCVKKGDGKYKIFLASSDQFYKDVTPQQKERLPRYKGDLLLIEHSAGSITSQAYMKRLNCKGEQLADSAERAAVAANLLGGIVYPSEKFDAAWKRVLASQFHDILPGTSIPRAYEYSWNDGIIALNLFSAGLTDSVGAVARTMDTNVDGRAVIVYNPLAIDRQDVVQAELEYPAGCPKNIEVLGPDRKVKPSQIISDKNNKLQILFVADVPSVGFAVYNVKPSETEQKFDTGLSVVGNTLENKYYKVVINAAGDIESIFDKQANKELLASPARLAFMNGKPKAWPAWNMDWKDQSKPPVGYVDGPAEIKITESGPVRVCIRVVRSSRNSVFKQYIRLGGGEAGKMVEVENRVEWQTGGCALKAEFPLTVSNPNATYNLGLGTIERGNNNEKKYEVPSHEWFDLTDTSGNYGVSILQDCKYGSDKPADNIVRLTLLYSPNTDDRNDYTEQCWQDWGKHEIKYAIYGHKGNWADGMTSWQARRFNQPLTVFEASAHKGKAGKACSFASLNTNQVEVLAIKKAEREDVVVVRVKELLGKPLKNVQLSLGNGVKSAYEVNGQEFKIGEAVVKDSKLTFDMGSYGIRSFAVELKSPAQKIAKPNYEFVKLDYNADAISSDKNKADGKMAQDCSYSADLVPDVIVSESVEFATGPKADGQNNVAVCKGQEIKLPKDKYNRLYVLAAADEDTKGVFKIGSQETLLGVQNWTGFIGQWYNRVFDREFPEVCYDGRFTLMAIDAPFIKRDTIAWFGKHRHTPTANDAYRFTYMFKYALDVPAGAKTIVLPNNDKIKIFAMTAANNQNDATKPACLLYDDFTNRKPMVLK